MFLKTRVISRFSTTRIDYKNWLKTSQILSNTAPVIQYQDNPELQAYKKKVFY